MYIYIHTYIYIYIYIKTKNCHWEENISKAKGEKKEWEIWGHYNCQASIGQHPTTGIGKGILNRQI